MPWNSHPNPMDTPLKINWDETFPHLAKPPIVEAVIHWQARAERPFDLEEWMAALSTSMTGYGVPEPIRQFEAMMFVQGDAYSSSHKQHVDGFRFASDDNLQIAQIKRDGVVFSRLKPYQDWEQFTGEALRIWQIFLDFAAPIEIERLGVRFINHLPSVGAKSLEQVLQDPPNRPANLPLEEFVYQSIFRVPEQPFAIRVIKLMPPQVPSSSESAGLFLDCEVYSTKPLTCDPEAVNNALTNMRSLKNRIFFTLLTDEAIRDFE